MSVASPTSLATDSPESTYRDALMSDSRPRTPTPPVQVDDSHDDYTPPRQSVRSGTIWITPSQRSNTPASALVLGQPSTIYMRGFLAQIPRDAF
jgi:hypothetical protein